MANRDVELHNSLLGQYREVAARMSNRTVGQIEPTTQSTPKANSLLLDGSTVSRDSYPALWQWVQDNHLVDTSVFGPGDGVTTFTLPDFRGRVRELSSGTVPVGWLIWTGE